LRQQIVDFVFAEGAVAIARPDAVHYFGSVAGMGRYNRVAKPWDVNAPSLPLVLLSQGFLYRRGAVTSSMTSDSISRDFGI